MLDRAKLIASFEEIIGWPYVSPGSNDQNGIDCSGAFVRAYRAQGASIYHGSNTIYRQYCSTVGKITSVADLQPGMAVFKQRSDNGEPAKFQGDGIGNIYHIGLVKSVNPLRIIHATTPVAKVDTSLFDSKGKPIWHYWGRLTAVPYDTAVTQAGTGTSPITDTSTGTGTHSGINVVNQSKEVKVIMTTAKVVTSGGTLNMRNAANGSAKKIGEIPNGATVQVIEKTNSEYWKVKYGGVECYAASSFLTESPPVTFELDRDTAEALHDALSKALA